MPLRVLTWNLFHGRAVPARDDDIFDAFAERLAAWSWDVALLQEVPPWWPRELARACDAQARFALTSRNALLPVRRALARRRPELMKSNGGGCNAILVRGSGIAAHARRRLRVWPERRVVHAVRDDAGRWFANVHGSTRPPRARADLAHARACVLQWAGEAPVVLGGDLNLRDPGVPGFVHAGGAHVDHVFARGWASAEPADAPERGALSDHAPVLATLLRV
jgi:endonuclease/exonuclease/phosphatase family metal-dependent hydrolase